LAITVLLILAAMWAAVLIPPVLRARTVQRSGDTIGDFSHRLSALARRSDRRPAHNPARGRIDSLARLQGGPALSAPTPVGGASIAMTPMQRRRRDVLVVLGGAAGFFCLVALVAQSAFTVFLALVALGALGAYCYALVQLKQRRIAAKAAEAEQLERSVKVRYLAHRERTVSAGAMLRRTASSH